MRRGKNLNQTLIHKIQQNPDLTKNEKVLIQKMDWIGICISILRIHIQMWILSLPKCVYTLDKWILVLENIRKNMDTDANRASNSI